MIPDFGKFILYLFWAACVGAIGLVAWAVFGLIWIVQHVHLGIG